MARMKTSIAAVLFIALLAPTACMVPEGTSTPVGAAGTPAASATGPGSVDQPLVMSYAASTAAPERAAGAVALAELLASETGLVVEATAADSPSALVRAVGAERTHVAWLDAFWYLSARDKHGAVPLVIGQRQGSIQTAAQLVVGTRSGIDSLDGLVGKTFCRPGQGATAWFMPLLTLRAWGVEEADLGRVVDVDDDQAVIRSVYEGTCDAGATSVHAQQALQGELADLDQRVRVLAVTDPVPNEGASVPQGLAPDVAEKVKNGLLAVSLTPEGVAAIRSMFGLDALAPVEDSAYDALRAALERSGLDIDQLLQESGT
jgi:phosphonate transport system substrate-binding protein